MIDHRICFVGDSMTHGTCDPEYLGWPGQVSKVARAAGYNLTMYNLGIRADTSRDILARWEAEVSARMNAGDAHYAVFCMGANDATIENSRLRVDTDESVENFGRILTASKENYLTLAIGPVPVGDAEQDDRIDALCDRLKAKAAELNVPYLPVSRMLRTNQTWLNSVAEQDQCHPGSAGYGVIAEAVMAWDKWWFR